MNDFRVEASNTIKPISEINREFEMDWVLKQIADTPIEAETIDDDIELITLTDVADENATAQKNSAKTLWNVISDLLFYLGVVIVIITAVLYGERSSGPVMIVGYSVMTVLTSSMQNVIPKGSLVAIHSIDPQKLNVGDDITYMRSESMSITHRIMKIFENYEDSGERGFQTQGVNNAEPDSDIVYAANVVGKVIFHVPQIGAFLSILTENLYLVFILFGSIMVLSFMLRGLFRKEKKGTEKNKKKTKELKTKRR
jgi:signal peptidase